MQVYNSKIMIYLLPYHQERLGSFFRRGAAIGSAGGKQEGEGQAAALSSDKRAASSSSGRKLWPADAGSHGSVIRADETNSILAVADNDIEQPLLEPSSAQEL